MLNRRNNQHTDGCVYTQLQMDLGGVGAVVGVVIIILVAFYIWLVRRDQAD